ncbi:MAG: ABC transporter permease [Bacillota bacterium]
MKGLIVREARIFLNAPLNLVVTLVTPLLYAFLFAESLSGTLPAVTYGGRPIPYLSYVAPGIAVFATLMFSNMSGPAIFQERVSGMLKEIATCPVTPTQYAASKIIVNSALALIEGLIVIGLFEVVLGGIWTARNLSLAALVLITGAIWLVSLYNLMWTLIRNGQTVSLVSNILSMVLVFTAPVFYPITSMPAFLQAVAVVNPLTYIVVTLRSVLFGYALDPTYVTVLLAGAALFIFGHVFASEKSMTSL